MEITTDYSNVKWQENGIAKSFLKTELSPKTLYLSHFQRT